MSKEKKRQFSLSLLVKIFLAIMIVVSLVVFVNSVMRFNELMEQQKALEQTKHEMTEEKEQLEELLESEGDENFIVLMARRFWGLFFPDEEIYFNNGNQ